MPEEWSYYLQT